MKGNVTFLPTEVQSRNAMETQRLLRESFQSLSRELKSQWKKAKGEANNAGYSTEDTDAEEEEDKVLSVLQLPFKDPQAATTVLNDPEKLRLFESWCRKQVE